MKKRTIIAIVTVALIAAVFMVGALATDMPFENLFENLSDMFKGYTSDEGQFLSPDYVSSKEIAVSEGETVWFGPCDPTQYFQLVGMNNSGETVTDKIRGKELTVADTFNNGMVIYQYTVPGGVSKLVFTAPESVAEVYTISKTEISELTWRAYWTQLGTDVDGYVGESSYYEVVAGDKLYFGAITLEQATGSVIYSTSGQLLGNFAEEDLSLVESFGGDYGIYCYTVPNDAAYARVSYDPSREQYYSCVMNAEAPETLAAQFVAEWGIQLPLESTVARLSGKSALFLGDSITFGARDRANIYGVKSINEGAGGWAARIGYFAGMDVTNNGVSGACISTARELSNSEKHYIYNNLVATAGTTYDYVIMHGLFNDASEKVEVGTMQGKDGFDPAKADVTTYAGGLELLFWTARQQNPNAILGFIVNFHTDRAVDQSAYVDMAIAICENWGIEYLDLYHLDGFSVEFDDGLHPSSRGYDSMYTIVANWMASLDGKLETNTQSATVMSYNVFHKTSDEAYPIENRYSKVASLIAAEDPDILLLQEATPDFLGTADGIVSGYEHFGYCNKCRFSVPAASGGVSSCYHELSSIAWKSEKYDLVASGALFTDEMDPSAHTDDYPRAINWVVLRDKNTGKELLVMNYHAAPDKSGKNNEAVRNAAARIIMEKLEDLRKEYGNIPAIFGGDMNAVVDSVAYNTMIQTVWDIRAIINPNAPGSYNAWNREEPSTFARGDYLFMCGDINASSYRVLTNDLDEDTSLHISDHSPIVIEVNFN